MLTRPLAAISLFVVLGGALAACAPMGADVADEGPVRAEESDLGAAQRSYVTLRRDLRKCAYPMCGGWHVSDVNRKNQREVYVAALDFADSDLDGPAADVVTSAPDGEVVLHGKLGDLADWDDPEMKTFRVSSAWRGMPGQTVAAGDVFHRVEPRDPPVQCFTAPCPNVEVTPLHTTRTGLVDRVETSHFAERLLDQEWLQARAVGGDAIVAGTVLDGEVFPGGPEQVLEASQVFVRLPEGEVACPQSRPACDPETEAAVYTRDADRCVVLEGCVQPGACALHVPTCSDGYALVSWTGGMFACTVYACDPAWLVPEPDPSEPPPSEPPQEG